jgi:hypothetical protein
MKQRQRSELADLDDLKKEHTNRKRHENNEMRQMNHIQTKRMQSEDFYSRLMQTKLDWKKKDILHDKKTQNFYFKSFCLLLTTSFLLYKLFTLE